MLVDCFCSQPAYLPHLAPVWEALPVENRGLFTIPGWFAHRVDFPTVSSVPRHGDVLLAAAVRDFAKDRHKYRVHLEHGAGQTYSNQHPAYPGGNRRGMVDLFLCPSERVADLEGDKAVVVGAPKLDRYADGQEPQGSDDDGVGTDRRSLARSGASAGMRAPRHPRVVALTWHWDAAGISPEAGTAWWEYFNHLHKLRNDSDWEVLGHAHPRIEQQTTPVYEKAGIEVVTDFDEIIRRADLLVVDNSSAAPEFAAATGRPVLFVASQAYRRDVNHGQRFWEWTEGQVQCFHPDGLDSAIRFALEDSPAIRAAREDMVRDAYAMLDGRAAERSVAAILGRLG